MKYSGTTFQTWKVNESTKVCTSEWNGTEERELSKALSDNDKRTNEQRNKQTHERKKERTHARTHTRTNEQTNIRTHEWTSEQTNEHTCTHARMNESTNARPGTRTHEHMNERTNQQTIKRAKTHKQRDKWNNKEQANKRLKELQIRLLWQKTNKNYLLLRKGSFSILTSVRKILLIHLNHKLAKHVTTNAIKSPSLNKPAKDKCNFKPLGANRQCTWTSISNTMLPFVWYCSTK